LVLRCALACCSKKSIVDARIVALFLWISLQHP
jgi:hypothetical protein